ncbi:MAG TPA: helix-turn-helix transcriptional regulator [Solirubrobacteraceae bacterium]|jgi:transcriptional regulator with XRE-family HTH domain
MKFEEHLTDEATLAELGARLERTRLERNLTQRELADEAGVERKALQRLEAGQPVRLSTFIRVLRVLGLLEALERLVPEPTPSPIELLKLHGHRRRRASGKRRGSTPGGEPAGPWQWGDESPGEESPVEESSAGGP